MQALSSGRPRRANYNCLPARILNIYTRVLRYSQQPIYRERLPFKFFPYIRALYIACHHIDDSVLSASFLSLNWLPFPRQSQIKRNSLVYKRINTSAITPYYIDRLLLRNSDTHWREIRYSNTNLTGLRLDPLLKGIVLVLTLELKQEFCGKF